MFIIFQQNILIAQMQLYLNNEIQTEIVCRFLFFSIIGTANILIGATMLNALEEVMVIRLLSFCAF